MATATLERFVPGHRDTDTWRDGLNDEAPITTKDSRYAYAVKVLEQVQLLTNTFFPSPREFSQDDVDALTWAAHLLQGETVTGTWKEAVLTLTPTAGGLEILGTEFNDTPMMMAQEQTLLIGDNGLPLGSIATHLLSVRVERWDGVGPDGKGRLTIAPSSTEDFESWRITGADTGIDRAIPGVSRAFRHQVIGFMDENDELLRRLAQ